MELFFPHDSDQVIINKMAEHREELEKAFDGTIIWQPLENKKASRIKYEVPHDELGGSFNDETN